MSRIQGDNLRVFPSMSQYGWCFVVDQKDDTRRGWVPGMSCHFHLTYFNQHFNLECFFTRNKRMQHSMACRALSNCSSQIRARAYPLSLIHKHTLGNYITVNGREPFMKAGGADEDELWSEVNNNERNMVHLEIAEVAREPKAPEDSPNLLQT
jgi:hypothetical protein